MGVICLERISVLIHACLQALVAGVRSYDGQCVRFGSLNHCVLTKRSTAECALLHTAAVLTPSLPCTPAPSLPPHAQRPLPLLLDAVTLAPLGDPSHSLPTGSERWLHPRRSWRVCPRCCEVAAEGVWSRSRGCALQQQARRAVVRLDCSDVQRFSSHAVHPSPDARKGKLRTACFCECPRCGGSFLQYRACRSSVVQLIHH